MVTNKASKGMLKNSHAKRIWSVMRTPTGREVEYRIVNNNKKVAGGGSRPVIIFRNEAPALPVSAGCGADLSAGDSACTWLADWLAPVPKDWVHEGKVQMAVTHATLSPKSYFWGKRSGTGSSSASAAAVSSDPKRQRIVDRSTYHCCHGAGRGGDFYGSRPH
jgi:hypothetical protein